jgi:hypothetical protein
VPTGVACGHPLLSLKSPLRTVMIRCGADDTPAGGSFTLQLCLTALQVF